MKKVFLILIFTTKTAFAADAQKTKGFQLHAGIRISLTPGVLLTSFNIGAGPEMQAEYKFSNRVSGIVLTGYNFFFGNEVTLFNQTFNAGNYRFIPVVAGMRYYPAKIFFIGLQGGAGIISSRDTSVTGFCWQLQTGFEIGKVQIAGNFVNNSFKNDAVGYAALTAVYKFAANKK
ncbi:MAG: hypothetical protein ACT4OJ_07495 [Bacteroidota bacterium]